ncbi:MAG: hypothetical protein JNM33_03015 [Rubrivivax sp.]|nr:hypothetical protein [Rubrivivax sp.]
MSLLLRSELRLRVGARRCQADLWRPGLRTRASASAVAEGEGDIVAEALSLLAGRGAKLPSQATVVLEDELLYYALLPAVHLWGAASDPARHYFADVLGERELRVSASLSPCGRRWMAVAVETAVLGDVTEHLARHGVALKRVGPALFEDLHALKQRLPDDGVVVWVRDQGLMAMRRHGGGWVEMHWDRCDSWQPEVVSAQVDAAMYRHTLEAATPPGQRVPVLVVAQRGEQASRLAPAAALHGWTLCRLRTRRQARARRERLV